MIIAETVVTIPAIVKEMRPVEILVTIAVGMLEKILLVIPAVAVETLVEMPAKILEEIPLEIPGGLLSKS
jgi:hypothetical protein